MRRGLTVLAFATVVALIGSLTAAASPAVGPKSTPQVAPGVGAAATYKNPPNPICSIARPSGATDYPIDCEAGVGIHNEEAIAVDPTDPDHWVASANDYQLKVSNGGQVAAYVFSRAKVTFDAGATWTTHPVPFKGYTGTGDPSIAFDDQGNVYFATLGNAGSNLPDVLVAHSTDGGAHWTQVRTAAGKGSFFSTSVFPDHPVLTAWGDGNVIVTWIRYVFGPHVIIRSAPMVAQASHDGGVSWTKPANVSGSDPTCVGLTAPTACDQTWGNAIAVSPSGEVLATFYDTYEYTPDGATNLGRTKHYSVMLDPSTGTLADGPNLIGQAYDGINEGDFPVSVDGRQTLQDSEFRLLMQGNITADPTDATGNHFAVVWFDDRNASAPVPADPYAAVTNSDVIVSQTWDGGATWSAPAAIALPNDQFMPWAAYDSNGSLRVGFFDRSYDAANHEYGYTVATETSPGSLSFTEAEATSVLSDPTQGNAWFATTVDPDFPRATRFIGDYSGIAAVGADVVVSWTDLRDQACLLGGCAAGQGQYVAQIP
ncbi:MAG TPA: sialidase family protein [Actinomycetota bacterium]